MPLASTVLVTPGASPGPLVRTLAQSWSVVKFCGGGCAAKAGAASSVPRRTAVAAPAIVAPLILLATDRSFLGWSIAAQGLVSARGGRIPHDGRQLETRGESRGEAELTLLGHR